MVAEKRLEVRQLSFSYDKKNKVFSDISFELSPGEVFVILGANGAGKSTLLNCLANALTPDSGEILIDGKNENSMSTRETALRIGYVPQITVPTFSYDVRDYVVMGRAPHMKLLSVPGPEDYAKADTVMEYMGISHLAQKPYSNISGGERQQAQIARVLVQETDIVLLDEPTNHLDYGNQLKILKVISSMARERGISVIFTTHMPDHALLINGKVGILNHNGEMSVGPVEEVMTEDILKNLYNTDLRLIYMKELDRTVCVSGKAELL